MIFTLENIVAMAFGLFGGLYVAFVIIKPLSKLDFFLRGSVGLLTGIIFTPTIAEKLSLDITAAAFIASCGAWPVIGLLYMVCTDPKHLIEILKAWKR